MAGNLNYFEIPAEDADRARGFWGSLFGWEFRDQPASVPYAMAQAGDLGVGLYESEERGLWAYFYVDDLDSAARQVEELGGKVRDKGPVPGVGWYARCEDTEGNRFGLFQTEASAA
jgi:predicted enzyme related to lactoylglutathione lyase